MGNKKQTFGSFADAASALNAASKSTKSQTANPRNEAPADHRSPNIRREDFADMEAAMLAKAKELKPEPTGSTSRRVMDVRHGERGGRKLVPASRLTSEQVAADIAAYHANQKPREEREQKKRMANERQKKEAAEAAAKKAFVAQMKAAQAEQLSKTAPPAAAPVPDVIQAPEPTKDDVLKAVRKVFAEAPPPIEPRAKSVIIFTRRPVEAAIARGAELFTKRPEPDHAGYIIGCDFGTSSVKIVVRQPYSASDPVARPAPWALQSTKHPYLWQTVVWFEEQSGRFTLFPAKGAIALEGFKAGILAGEGGKRVVPNLPVTRNEAAAAFLALQLSHCLGWYDIARPLGDQGAAHFLAINVGIPVAAQDDAKTYRDFSHILNTARDLISETADLRLDHVRTSFQASSDQLPEGFDLVPELAAAISGYANEPHARDGSHMMIDVGASTLDIVAFNLVDRERVSAFAAEVELLGAAALDASRDVGLPDELFQGACIGQFSAVFNYARRGDVAPRNFDQALRRNPVQLIIMGGGCKTAVHKEMIAKVHPILGDLTILSPKPPIRLPAGPCDTSRLLLAYGLTADIPEQLELRRPSDIPRIKPLEAASVTFVSKDQM